jgi:hypothetical protein
MDRRGPVFLALACGVFAVSLGPITDGDLFWHLAAGREMLSRHALPRLDAFTVSAAGRPWVDVHWLFQLAVAGIERGSGLVGIAIAKAVAMAAGAVILARTAERSAGPVARDLSAVSLFGLLFLARHLVPTRPTIVTLLLLAAYLAILEAHRMGTRRSLRALLVLPALQIVWVNCQGLAPLGPALIAAYLVGGALAASRANARDEAAVAWRPLAVALALCIPASFVTPYGVQAITLPFHLLARIVPGGDDAIFSREIAENVPPFLLERTAPELIGHFKWVLAGVGVALAIVRPRVHPAHALLLVAFGGLALAANRNVPLFYWLLAPIGAIALAPAAVERLAHLPARIWISARARSRVATGLLGAVLAAELTCATVALAGEATPGTPTPFHFPGESARRLDAMGATGPIFAADQHGGFLSFTVPGVKPYIDTRLVLHSAGEYADYLAVVDDPRRFDALDATVGFRYVVLPTANPDRYLGLLTHIAGSGSWRLLFTDGYEALFAREGAALDLGDQSTINDILSDQDTRLREHPPLLEAARVHLSRMLIVLGQPAEARRVVDTLGSRTAAGLRARAHLAGGDVQAAEGLARVLLVQEPHDGRILTLLGEIALLSSRRADAVHWAGQALAADPYDAGARALLARLTDALPDRTP